MKETPKIDVELQAQVLSLGQTLSEVKRGLRPVGQSVRPEVLEADVERILGEVRNDPARKYFGITRSVVSDDDPARLKAIAFIGWQMVGDQHQSTSIEAISAAIGNPTEDQCEQILLARDLLGRMVSEELLVLIPNASDPWSGKLILPTIAYMWLVGGERSKGGFTVRLPEPDSLKKCAAETGKPVTGSQGKSPTAKQLFEKVSQDVIGLEPQIRALASRVALHLARARLLMAGLREDCVGQMCVCLVGESGSGKTYLASRLAVHSGLPYCIYDCTSLTSMGYVGSDLDEPYRLLIASAQGDARSASRGLLFFDEFDKKSLNNGRDVCGLAIQQELLGRFQTVGQFVVGGKRQFDCKPILFDGRPVGYFLGGVFSGLDEVLGKMMGKKAMGFSCQKGEKSHVYIQDALKEMGFIDELVNRISSIVRLPRPTHANIVHALITGMMDAFNRVLEMHGIFIILEEKACRVIADYAVESRGYYRSAKAVMGTLAEEFLSEGMSGTVPIEKEDAERAISRLTSGVLPAVDADSPVAGSEKYDRVRHDDSEKETQSCGG